MPRGREWGPGTSEPRGEPEGRRNRDRSKACDHITPCKPRNAQGSGGPPTLRHSSTAKSDHGFHHTSRETKAPEHAPTECASFSPLLPAPWLLWNLPPENIGESPSPVPAPGGLPLPSTPLPSLCPFSQPSPPPPGRSCLLPLYGAGTGARGGLVVSELPGRLREQGHPCTDDTCL